MSRLRQSKTFDGTIDGGKGIKETRHLTQGYRVGPVAQCLVRIGVRFHEYPGNAHRDRRARQWRNELSLTA